MAKTSPDAKKSLTKRRERGDPPTVVETDLETTIAELSEYSLDAAYHAFIAELFTLDEVIRDIEASLES